MNRIVKLFRMDVTKNRILDFFIGRIQFLSSIPRRSANRSLFTLHITKQSDVFLLLLFVFFLKAFFFFFHNVFVNTQVLKLESKGQLRLCSVPLFADHTITRKLAPQNHYRHNYSPLLLSVK